MGFLWIFHDFGAHFGAFLDAKTWSNPKRRKHEKPMFSFGKVMFSRFQAIDLGMKICKKTDAEKEGILGWNFMVLGSILVGFWKAKTIKNA